MDRRVMLRRFRLFVGWRGACFSPAASRIRHGWRREESIGTDFSHRAEERAREAQGVSEVVQEAATQQLALLSTHGIWPDDGALRRPACISVCRCAMARSQPDCSLEEEAQMKAGLESHSRGGGGC